MAKRGKKKEPSRYQRVKQILNEAQGDTVPDYQGYHAFWLLPVKELLRVELYGQLMIAPPEEGDATKDGQPEAGCGCGHCTPAPATDADDPVAPDPSTNCWPSAGPGGGSLPSGSNKRSDRSGLIIGLRGQHPFNGTVFPPLLWNAARKVTDSEIALIAAWIDAGCPTGDEDTPTDVIVKQNEENELRARARGDAPHPASDRHINEHRSEVNGLHVRKDARCLSKDEWDRLREAIACASRYNDYWLDERSYDFWARIHTNSCQHGWEQFLPWHRLYLYFFEQHLQDYDARITLPYWDWAAYANANKAETEQLDTGVIPQAYRCWLDADGLARLKEKKTPAGKSLFTRKQIAKLTQMAREQTVYNSGLRFLAAADTPYTLDTSSGVATWSPAVRAVYDELQRINRLWFPSRWPGSVGTAAHYPTPGDIDTILSIKSFSEFGGGPVYDHHFGALEEVHNGMHNFAGGLNKHFQPGMGPQDTENPQFGYMTENRTTAFDPVFWAHHSNVDRLWARWQELNPGANPEDLDGILPPWSLSVRDTLSTKKLGYEYMKECCFFPVANHVPITRFTSETVSVQLHVLETFRKAELRLHRVQRGNMPNASIRAFLNAPKADAKTPLESSKGYAGQVTTFHTYCYGGPGHCDLPLPRTRRFDQRPLHHHEPRNFRIDVSETVRDIIGKRKTGTGADETIDISVQLVVIGIDGQLIDNALFIDGVSLNFMD